MTLWVITVFGDNLESEAFCVVADTLAEAQEIALRETDHFEHPQIAYDLTFEATVATDIRGNQYDIKLELKDDGQ